MFLSKLHDTLKKQLMRYVCFMVALINCSEKSLLANIVLRNADTGKNPLEENAGACDPKRPNIFIDRNNLLGKTPPTRGPDSLEFSYANGPTGPAHWYKFFKQCGGKHQSPIDINLSTLKNIQMPKITWDKAYSEMPEQITVANNGHSVEIQAKFANGSVPKIQGGPMSSPYSLSQIHFHWGTTDHKGSEHTINGKTFPMEMHAVHVKQHLSLEQAGKLPDGIVVVSYIFEIEDTCHQAIKYVEESFDLIEMDLNTAQPLQNMFPMSDLAEPFCNGYVTYKGSLTTPPCSEAVTWIVSPYTVGVSARQLERFRSLYATSKSLENNFRPTQPLNGRTVHFVN